MRGLTSERQADGRWMVRLRRSPRSRRLLRRRGCSAHRKKERSQCSLTRASGREATSSRQLRWAHRASWVGTCFLFITSHRPPINEGFSITVGRPVMYGLAVGGQQGVEEVLQSLLADTEATLGLSGYKSIEEIWARRGAVLEKAEMSLEKSRL